MGRFVAGLLAGLLAAFFFTTSWGSVLLALGLGAFVWFLYRRDPHLVRDEARRFAASITSFFREVFWKIKGR